MGLGSALEPDWRENPEEGTKKKAGEAQSPSEGE